MFIDVNWLFFDSLQILLWDQVKHAKCEVLGQLLHATMALANVTCQVQQNRLGTREAWKSLALPGQAWRWSPHASFNESQAERLPLFFWSIDLQMDYNSGNSQLALINATVGFMEAVLLHLHHEMKHQICLHAWHMPKNSPRRLPSTQDDPKRLWCRQQ